MNLKGFDPRAGAFFLFDEFKNFAFKGNVIDMAVGVIIGGAFGDLVKSIVNNILMPLVAAIFGADPASGFKGYTTPVNGSPVTWGVFLADFINFVILAAALFFFVVKFLGWIMKAKKQEAVAPPPPAPPTKEQELLSEIRDLLKAKA